MTRMVHRRRLVSPSIVFLLTILAVPLPPRPCLKSPCRSSLALAYASSSVPGSAPTTSGTGIDTEMPPTSEEEKDESKEQCSSLSSGVADGECNAAKDANKNGDDDDDVDDDKESEKKVYVQDGPEAREIAKYLPYFPFKGIPRFYDIGGFLAVPTIFRKIVDIFVARYRDMRIDSVAGLDARGFVLGPPIALALNKPFVMMRKKGKMPNSVQSQRYDTEYGSREGMTVQRDKIAEGHRVLIIDDLVATGGTLSSAISLVRMLGGVVAECACVVELKMFIDPPPDSGLPSRTKLFRSLGMDDVPIWGLVSEDVLTVEAELHKDYVDDGEEH